MKKYLTVALAVATIGIFSHSTAEAGGVYFSVGSRGIQSSRFQRNYGYGYGHGYNNYNRGWSSNRYRNPHGGSVWHNQGHYDYHPGGYVPHGNHYDYIPGHYDWHDTSHWDRRGHFGH